MIGKNKLTPRGLEIFLAIKKISQHELAHRIGCSQATINLMIKGYRPISEKDEALIFKALAGE